MSKRKKSRSLEKNYYGLYFILPYIILFLFIQLVPMIYTFILSLNRWDGLMEKTYIGFENYKRLITDKLFYKSIYNTVIIWLINIGPRMALALLCAVLLTRPNMKYVNTYKAVLYFPNLVTAASIATLFNFLFDWQGGTVNQILLKIGLIAEPIKWLGVPSLTRGIAATIVLWMWFGYAVILFMSGMLTIPRELYQAAQIDGANEWQQFWKVTLPNMKSSFSYVFITALIGGLQNFDIPKLLTDGAGSPDRSIMTITMYMHTQAFEARQFGYGSTIAYALFIIVLFVSLFTFNMINGKKEERV